MYKFHNKMIVKIRLNRVWIMSPLILRKDHKLVIDSTFDE